MGRKPRWQREGREKGTIVESGDAIVDQKRIACINKILQFDECIDFKSNFDFLFAPGVGSRPKRLINHLIGLECLPHLGRIYDAIFLDPRTPDAVVESSSPRRSRSPFPRPALQIDQASSSGQPSSASSDVHLTGVLIRNPKGEPIDFGNGTDPEKLLDVVASYKQHETNIKREIEAKNEVEADVSEDGHGVVDLHPERDLTIKGFTYDSDGKFRCEEDDWDALRRLVHSEVKDEIEEGQVRIIENFGEKIWVLQAGISPTFRDRKLSLDQLIQQLKNDPDLPMREDRLILRGIAAEWRDRTTKQMVSRFYTLDHRRLWCMHKANCPKLRFKVVLQGRILNEIVRKADNFGSPIYDLKVRDKGR